MRSILMFALGVLLAGCSAGKTAPTQATGGSSISRGEATEGAFRLVFELPRTTWKASDAIDGTATLALVSGGEVMLGVSGSGVVGFEFEEIGGSRRVDPIWSADCVSRRWGPGVSITSPIKKSGAEDSDQPGADFRRGFLSDPLVHLPAGDWRITAVAVFAEGERCTGPSHTVRATALVNVVA